jgi:hypothetical protein
MIKSKRLSMVFVAAVVAVAMFGCSKPADEGKIPITTKSDEARKEYMLGRDLTDRLQTHEANGHFDKAIAADPEFAMAYLLRGNGAASTTEFLEVCRESGLARRHRFRRRTSGDTRGRSGIGRRRGEKERASG